MASALGFVALAVVGWFALSRRDSPSAPPATTAHAAPDPKPAPFTPDPMPAPSVPEMPEMTASPPKPPEPDRLRGIPPQKHYTGQYKVDEEYDRFRGSTAYRLSSLRLPKIDDEERELSCFWVLHEDETQRAPARVHFMLTRHGDQWRYLHFHPVHLLLDGRRSSAEGEHEGRVGKGYVLEWVSWSMGPQEFLDLVNSSAVEIRVGRDDFRLGENEMLALKDLASRMPARR